MLPSNLSSQESQLVGNVDTGSPAEAAGVKKGDKIIEVSLSSRFIKITLCNENVKALLM